MDSPVNGEVFTIVPDKIFLFKTPSSLVPEGQDWMDKDGIRHFSPGFYADLFDYLGVRLVMQLDRAKADYDSGVFERRGVAVCGLKDLGCTDPATRFSLQTAGRFIDVVRQTEGPVAIHCDDRLAATLISMHLLRAGLFADSQEAVAWIAMARGAACGADYGLLALDHGLAASGRERLPQRAHSLADLAVARR